MLHFNLLLLRVLFNNNKIFTTFLQLAIGTQWLCSLYINSIGISRSYIHLTTKKIVLRWCNNEKIQLNEQRMVEMLNQLNNDSLLETGFSLRKWLHSISRFRTHEMIMMNLLDFSETIHKGNHQMGRRCRIEVLKS